MDRMLIVEDVPETSDMLAKLLLRKFPDFHIDTASDVETAQSMMEERHINNEDYHIYVQDYLLPQRKGGVPIGTTALCLQSGAPNLVIHMTAYPDDEGILKHMKECHTDRKDSGGKAVSKLDADWPEQIIERIREHVYTLRVDSRLDTLFGSEETSNGANKRMSSYGAPASIGGISHRLAELMNAIREYWPYLHPLTKKRVEALFGSVEDVNK